MNMSLTSPTVLTPEKLRELVLSKEASKLIKWPVEQLIDPSGDTKAGAPRQTNDVTGARVVLPVDPLPGVTSTRLIRLPPEVATVNPTSTSIMPEGAKTSGVDENSSPGGEDNAGVTAMLAGPVEPLPRIGVKLNEEKVLSPSVQPPALMSSSKADTGPLPQESANIEVVVEAVVTSSRTNILLFILSPAFFRFSSLLPERNLAVAVKGTRI
jgi:hypothetical protein